MSKGMAAVCLGIGAGFVVLALLGIAIDLPSSAVGTTCAAGAVFSLLPAFLSGRPGSACGASCRRCGRSPSTDAGVPQPVTVTSQIP